MACALLGIVEIERQRPARKFELPGVWFRHAAQNAHERALARAVSADEAEHDAASNGQ